MHIYICINKIYLEREKEAERKGGDREKQPSGRIAGRLPGDEGRIGTEQIVLSVFEFCFTHLK